jgi:hypothetical protein
LSGGIKTESGSHPPVSESQSASALKRPSIAVYSKEAKHVVSSLPTFEQRIKNCVLVYDVMVLLDSDLEGCENCLKNDSSRIRVNGNGIAMFYVKKSGIGGGGSGV